jgi:hypothetical protein
LQLWSIYTRAIDTHAILFTTFSETHKPSDGELKKSSSRLYAELLLRTGDPTERIREKAVGAIKTMMQNEKVRKQDNLQYLLTEPLK